MRPKFSFDTKQSFKSHHYIAKTAHFVSAKVLKGRVVKFMNNTRTFSCAKYCTGVYTKVLIRFTNKTQRRSYNSFLDFPWLEVEGKCHCHGWWNGLSTVPSPCVVCCEKWKDTVKSSMDSNYGAFNQWWNIWLWC